MKCKCNVLPIFFPVKNSHLYSDDYNHQVCCTVLDSSFQTQIGYLIKTRCRYVMQAHNSVSLNESYETRDFKNFDVNSYSPYALPISIYLDKMS